MRLFRYYIISKVKEALTDPTPAPLSDPSQPTVAPEDSPVFPENIMRQLEFFKEKALLVKDFEGFSALLEQAAIELNLNPAQDLEKIASILNLYRTQAVDNPL